MSEAVEFAAPSDDSVGAQQKMHFVSRQGVSPQEVTDIYKDWAQAYDNDVGQVGWNAPRYGAELVRDTLAERHDARILDAASGTGLGGKLMKELGYTNIDAVDACAEMLEVSRKLQCYTNYIEAFLDNTRLPIEDDTYDMVITYGSFVPGHLKENCFEQIARVIKPGGYFGLIMCERYFSENPEYAGRIEPRMSEMGNAGVWQLEKRRIIPNYHGAYNGVSFLLRLLPDKQQALAKLAAQ